MKHFGYYVTPGKTDTNGNSTDKVTVFRIKDNRPMFIRTVSRDYRTAGQAAVATAIDAGHLGIAHKGKTAARLYNDGIANFTEV